MPKETDPQGIRVLVEESLDDILNRQLQNVIVDESNYDDILKSMISSDEVQSVAERIEGNLSRRQSDSWNSTYMFENIDYKNITETINKNKTASNTLKSLQPLLSGSLIEATTQKCWPQLSKILQECLISKNSDLFDAGLKIHKKLISFSGTANEGFQNLVESLTMCFKMKKGLFPLSCGIDMSNSVQNHIVQIFELIVPTQKEMTLNWVRSKDKDIENVMEAFLELFCLRNISGSVKPLNYVSVLDPKATWFRCWTYGLSWRKILFNLLPKYDFFKYIITEFYGCNNTSVDGEPFGLTNTQIIRFATFSHCTNLISQLLNFSRGREYFPISIPPKTLLISDIIITFASRINTLNHCTERRVLCEAITNILIKNSLYLDNKDVVAILFDTFTQRIQPVFVTASKNVYIVDIINSVLTTHNHSSLFGINNKAIMERKRSKRFTRSRSRLLSASVSEIFKTHRDEDLCPVIVTVDFTSLLLRKLVTDSELENIDDTALLYVNCCLNIFKNCINIFTAPTTQKFTLTLVDYYKTLLNKNFTMSRTITSFLCFAFGHPLGRQLLKTHEDILYDLFASNVILITLKSPTNSFDFYSFILNIAESPQGCQIINENSKKIIEPLLNKIWEAEEDEMNFLSGSSRDIENAVNRFIEIMFTITFSITAFRSFVSEDESEGTLVESEVKPLSVTDLLENALAARGPGTTVTYVGLLTLDLLITNLDILLYYQNKTSFAFQLTDAQEECMIEKDTSKPFRAFIVDECSSLRDNILNKIDSIGFRGMDNSSSTSVLRKGHRAPNELQKFLYDFKSGLHDFNWLVQLRRLYRSTSADIIKTNVLIELVEQVHQSVPIVKRNFSWSNNHFDLCPEDVIGMNTVLNFGVKSGLLQQSPLNEQNFITLLEQSKAFLRLPTGVFEGFDWFVAVIFLICAGNVEKSRNLLTIISELPVAPFIWKNLGDQVDLYSMFDHYLGVMIEDDTEVNSVLQMSKISWNYVSRQWIRQCFFNVLEWNEACHWLALCIMHPPEYSLFYVMTILKYKQNDIINVSVSDTLLNRHNVLNLEKFRIAEWLDHMDKLSKQYKHVKLKQQDETNDM